MQDGLQKGNIDLDELVNTLLKEKVNTAADRQPEPSAQKIVPETPQEEPVAEPMPAVEEMPIFLVSGQEEDADADAEEESVLDEESSVGTAEQRASVEASQKLVAEDEKPLSKSRRRLFGFLRREKESEDILDEEWADWGLKPIGHYHKDRISDTEELEDKRISEESEAEPEPTRQAETSVEDITSGRETPAEEHVIEETAVEETAVEETAVEETAVEEDVVEETLPMSVPRVDPATVVMPAVRPTAPMVEDVTRVVEISKDAPMAEVSNSEQPEAEEPPQQLPDQLSLEELVRVEDVEDAEPIESEENAAIRLQRARQEKVKEFVLSGDEEEDNEPEEEAVEQTAPEDEPEIEDFTGYETTKAVRLELQYRWRTGLISLLLTIGLEVMLLLLTMLTLSLGQSPITAVGYLTAHVFCLVLMLVLNYPSVSRGLSGLFMLKANNDTAPAMATVVALCGTILHFLNLDAPLPVFAPLAGLLMLLGAAGQCIKLARIRENFSFVSYPGTKYSAALVEDEKAALEIGRRVSTEEPVDVAYFRRTAFLSTYLSNAYEEDGGDRFAKIGAPISMALSLALSAVMLILGAADGFWEWLSTFVFMLCLSAFTTVFAMQLPMKNICRRMLSKGGFLVGWNAVDTFGRPDALAVDIADLYPDESMLLHGIKTFSGMHIDEAILDAASLSIRSGGPLSMIFRRIIQNKEELLHEVDSLVYEQGMGLSGWVDGRRVLVGNRRLLQNHGVDVPSSDYEARYAKNGRRLVYLSTAGELSAMFVVSYLPDEAIGDALRQLCRAHVTLLVRSNDSNITAADLCQDFDLDEYYVDVLPAVACRMYDQLVAEESESLPATMASNGHILGTAMVLAACRALQVKARISLVMQIIIALVGLLLGVFWAQNVISSYFLPAFGFMLLSALVSWLVPLFKRV